MLKCYIKTMALWVALLVLAAVTCNAAAGWAYFEAVAPCGRRCPCGGTTTQ